MGGGGGFTTGAVVVAAGGVVAGPTGSFTGCGGGFAGRAVDAAETMAGGVATVADVAGTTATL